MSVVDLLLIFAAGVGGGLINAVVGSGTLITFPTLIALGLPPVTSNVSNAVGLFPGSLASAWGYRAELKGARRRAISLGIGAIIGGLGGAGLLLVLPASAFETVAPILIAVALALVLFGRRLNRWLTSHGYKAAQQVTVPLWVCSMLVAVYGGYFGAAQGVLMMGVFAVLMEGSVQHHNAVKNLLSGVSKLVAAIIFMASAAINWPAAGMIAAGSVLGGLLGARFGRWLPPNVLRAVIVVIGVVAIVELLK